MKKHEQICMSDLRLHFDNNKSLKEMQSSFDDTDYADAIDWLAILDKHYYKYSLLHQISLLNLHIIKLFE